LNVSRETLPEFSGGGFQIAINLAPGALLYGFYSREFQPAKWFISGKRNALTFKGTIFCGVFTSLKT
jgi:hypothetical protein